MIHGKVAIELYNPNTKIKNIVRGENTFQSTAIAGGLRNLGAANASRINIDAVRQYPLWHEAVGGILLFRDSIQEGKLYMPAGNKMIGNGCVDVTNAAQPNELGSYNDFESSAENGTITQVYDFTTNQANGQISCVSLTSRLGGYMGYGNAGGVSASAKNINENGQLQSVNPQGSVEWGARAVVANTEYRFTYDTSEHKITVQKTPIALTQASMFTGLTKSVVLDVSELEYATVVPSGLQCTCVDNGKIYLSDAGGREVAVGGTYKYWEYNPADDSITVKTFTNTSTHPVGCRFFSIAHGLFITRVNYVFEDEWMHMAVFNASTSVHIGDYKTTNNRHTEDSSYKWGPIHEGLIMGCGCGYNANATTTLYMLIYDPVNDTLYPTNISGDFNYRNQGYQYDPTTNSFSYNARYNCVALNSPLYLATIYNLQSPVTKTPAQTMKVTYTLTEA